MKFKTILISIVVLGLVILIYIFNLDRKVYVLELTQNNYSNYITTYLKNKNKFERYVNGFIEKDDRTTDLLKYIDNNKKIQLGSNNYTLQNSLIKADIILVEIGSKEAEYISNYNDADEFLSDIEKLFLDLRKYSKEKIIYIGPILDTRFEKYINNKLENLCDKNKIIFIPYDEYLIEGKILSILDSK